MISAPIIETQNFGDQDVAALIKEANYAFEKWGLDFDDKNTLNDWLTYAGMYGTDAARMGATKDEQYAMLIKAAHLMLCAAGRVRQGALPDRHYEGQPARGEHGAGRAFLK